MKGRPANLSFNTALMRRRSKCMRKDIRDIKICACVQQRSAMPTHVHGTCPCLWLHSYWGGDDARSQI